jgi:hypothetical protein
MNVGAALDVGSGVCLGVSATNVNAGAIGDEQELPVLLALGAGWRPTGEVNLQFELLKDVRYPMEFHLGAEYSFLDVLALRAGLSTEPSLYSAGCGLHAGFARFDYAFTAHPDLGLTHSISLTLAPFDL